MLEVQHYIDRLSGAAHSPHAGSGKEWIEAELDATVGMVQHPPKLRGVWAPERAAIDRE